MTKVLTVKVKMNLLLNVRLVKCYLGAHGVWCRNMDNYQKESTKIGKVRDVVCEEDVTHRLNGTCHEF